MDLWNPGGVRDWLRLHPAPTRPNNPLSRYERHTLFREMVAGELHRGPLNRFRRRRLVQYAARLDIRAVEAGRLITEARRAFEQSLPERTVALSSRTLQSPRLKLAAPAKPWPLWVKLTLVLAAVALLKATVLRWVLA